MQREPHRFQFNRRKATDYTQRSIKLRLFGLVAALLLVMTVAERAGDPKSWQWLWTLGQENREAPFTNRLQPAPLRTEGDPLGTFISADEPTAADDATASGGHLDRASGGRQPPEATDAEAKSERPAFDPAQRAWDQGWKDVYDRLEPAEKSLLFAMLHAAAGRQPLDPEHVTPAAELLGKLAALWKEYEGIAFESVADLAGDDRSQWLEVLRQVNERFTGQLQPALQAVVDGRTPTEAEDTALVAFKETLVALVTSHVEDDTVLRPAEREYLFDLFARVQQAPPEELRQQAPEQVAYLQLHKQPDVYRGQPVTIRGTAKMAYRVPALENYLGIEEYYALWIHPLDGPNAPIVVYVLAPPPGFPPISERANDWKANKLHEDLTVTGLFFKRWAYPGQDGTYTAPLLVARSFDWQPRPAVDLSRPQLGALEYAAIFVAALAATVLFVSGMAWGLRRRRRGDQVDLGPEATNVAAMRNLAVAPSTQESLQALERDARAGKL